MSQYLWTPIELKKAQRYNNWKPIYGVFDGHCIETECCWNDLRSPQDWKNFRHIASDENVEVGGYVWWFYGHPQENSRVPRLEKWLLCPEHSNQVLLLTFGERGFYE